jgi:hypothetical protein
MAGATFFLLWLLGGSGVGDQAPVFYSLSIKVNLLFGSVHPEAGFFVQLPGPE